jgi:hypothetical protein
MRLTLMSETVRAASAAVPPADRLAADRAKAAKSQPALIGETRFIREW